MTRQANNTKEELTRVLAQPNQRSAELIPEGIQQRELKEYVIQKLKELYDIDISARQSKNTAIGKQYKSVFKDFEYETEQEAIKDLLELFKQEFDDINKEEFLKPHYRKKYVDEFLKRRTEPLKNLHKLNVNWNDKKIREIALFIREKYSNLNKLVQSPKHESSRNIPAEAIVSSQSIFMTKNRHTQLDAFKNQLESEKLLVLAGERGSGKTLFVNVFIQKYHSDYKHIIYTTVKAGHIIEGFVKSIGDYLGVQIQSEENLLEQLQVALMLLKERNLSGLICIDNANTPGALETFLKEWEKYPFLKDSINLVITTYCRTEKAANFSLESLKETDAKEIFDQYVKNETKKALSDIAIKLFAGLGYIPILVEQVSLLIENNHRLNAQDLRGLNNLFQKTAQEPVIANPDGSKFYDGDEKTVIGFIQELFNRMAEKISDNERLLLQYFSLLPAKAYSEPELIDLMPLKENDLDRIDELVKKGWLLKKGNGFYCHELYQLAIRELLPIKTAEVNALLVKIEDKIRLGDIRDMERSVLDVMTYASYAENIVENLTFLKESISLKDSDLNQKLSDLENCSGVSKNDQISLAYMLSSLGHVNFDLSLWDKALYYYYNGLRMQLRLEHQNSWEYGRHLGVFANFIKRENKEMASKYLEKSYIILKSDANTPNWVYVRQYGFLGRLLRDQALFNEAETVLGNALSICDEDPELQFDKAQILDNLGLVYGSLGSKAAAEHPGEGKEFSETSLRFRESALELRRKIHQHPENLKVGIILNNMGAIYSKLERMDEAIKSYNESIFIRKKIKLPDIHNSFAVVFNNMAMAMAKKVRLSQCSDGEKPALLDKAYSYFEEALKIREQLNDKESSDFGFNYHTKSQILFEKGKLQKSLTLLYDATEAGKEAIDYKNKADVPIKHEILEIENLIKEIELEIQKLENEQKN